MQTNHTPLFAQLLPRTVVVDATAPVADGDEVGTAFEQVFSEGPKTAVQLDQYLGQVGVSSMPSLEPELGRGEVRPLQINGVSQKLDSGDAKPSGADHPPTRNDFSSQSSGSENRLTSIDFSAVGLGVSKPGNEHPSLVKHGESKTSHGDLAGEKSLQQPPSVASIQASAPKSISNTREAVDSKSDAITAAVARPRENASNNTVGDTEITADALVSQSGSDTDGRGAPAQGFDVEQIAGMLTTESVMVEKPQPSSPLKQAIETQLPGIPPHGQLDDGRTLAKPIVDPSDQNRVPVASTIPEQSSGKVSALLSSNLDMKTVAKLAIPAPIVAQIGAEQTGLATDEKVIRAAESGRTLLDKTSLLSGSPLETVAVKSERPVTNAATPVSNQPKPSVKTDAPPFPSAPTLDHSGPVVQNKVVTDLRVTTPDRQVFGERIDVIRTEPLPSAPPAPLQPALGVGSATLSAVSLPAPGGLPGEEQMEFALVSGDVDQPQRDAQQSPQEIRLTRNVATQLIEVARALPDRPVEITLNPEELGKLRMTVTTNEGGISVSLLAERAETTELLRRHIEILSQEFQALGYSDISFNFGGGGDSGGNDQNELSGDTNEATVMHENERNAAPLRVELDGRVDIRI